MRRKPFCNQGIETKITITLKQSIIFNTDKIEVKEKKVPGRLRSC